MRADALLGGKALGAGHHDQGRAGIGQAQAQAALAQFLERLVVLRRIGLDDDVVEAEALDHAQRLAPAALAHALQGDDGADAENQAEQGQEGTQLAPRQFLDGFAPRHGIHGAVSPFTGGAAPSTTRSPRSSPDTTWLRAAPLTPRTTLRATVLPPCRTCTRTPSPRVSSARLGTLNIEATSIRTMRAPKRMPGIQPYVSAASGGNGTFSARYLTGLWREVGEAVAATQDTREVTI